MNTIVLPPPKNNTIERKFEKEFDEFYELFLNANLSEQIFPIFDEKKNENELILENLLQQNGNYFVNEFLKIY